MLLCLLQRRRNDEIQMLTQGCAWSQGVQPTEAGESTGFLSFPGFSSCFKFCRSSLCRNLSILPPHERRLLDEAYHLQVTPKYLPLSLEDFISFKKINKIALFKRGSI